MFMGEQMEALAMKLQAQIQEHCQPEIQRLKAATKVLWANKNPEISNIVFLRQIKNDLSDDSLVLAWRKAVEEFITAVKTKTDNRARYSRAAYIGVVEEAMDELDKEDSTK